MGSNDRRIVVKIGSQVLCDASGELSVSVLSSLVGQMARLREEGWQVLLVSSGAVAAGTGQPGLGDLLLNDPVTRKQVLAATGQVRLMRTYEEQFGRHGITIAQVLASKSDFQTRNHYLNMRNCIEGILSAGILPVVNENDVVSITELMFTDNDELAGLLAGMVNAELMCLLTTVAGVYDDSGSEIIGTWDDDVHQIEDVVTTGTSQFGRGGMHSKLTVARRTAALGTEVAIADGNAEDILLRITDGQAIGTRFPAGSRPSPAKRWLASADGHAVGTVRINAGAARALLDRNRLTSLLPVGIESLDGDFRRGDVIGIVGADGRVLGCGRAQYDRAEAERYLGQKGMKPLIHYDYLYLTD